jgi:hypothetical protein
MLWWQSLSTTFGLPACIEPPYLLNNGFGRLATMRMQMHTMSLARSRASYWQLHSAQHTSPQGGMHTSWLLKQVGAQLLQGQA